MFIEIRLLIPLWQLARLRYCIEIYGSYLDALNILSTQSNEDLGLHVASNSNFHI